MNKIRKFLMLVTDLPKTILFNFTYFPLKVAIKFPVFVSHRVFLLNLKGKVKLGVVRTGVIRIGYGDLGIFDHQRSRSIWSVLGTVEFKGSARIGHGSKIGVVGELVLGDNFRITAESAIVAHKKVVIGANVLVSWDVLIMDTDMHHIHAQDGSCINAPSEVNIGNRVWIGCRSLILKGVTLPEGIIVAASTTVTRSVNCLNAIIGGNPARIIRENITWRK